MNKFATFTFVLSALALNAGIAHAEETKVATVDMQKCIQSSAAGKKAKSELEAAFNKKKKELTDQEASLKKAKEDFEKKASGLSEAAANKKKQELQEKFMKYQETVQKSQSDIQKKEQEMSAPIIAKIRAKINEIAAAKGYELVLEKNENIVLFSEAKNDITEEVMKGI